MLWLLEEFLSQSDFRIFFIYTISFTHPHYLLLLLLLYVLNLTWSFYVYFQCAIAMVMQDGADSIWNFSSYLDGFQAEFASNVDMQRLAVTVTTAKKDSIEIPRNQWLIERFVNVSNYNIYTITASICYDTFININVLLFFDKWLNYDNVFFIIHLILAYLYPVLRFPSFRLVLNYGFSN